MQPDHRPAAGIVQLWRSCLVDGRLLPPPSALLLTAGVTASQYVPPRMPPPLPSVYELLDLAPAPAVTCTCVPDAFALPAYRPGWGYGTGPAVPFTDAPLSDADLRRNLEWDAAEERDVRAMADEALEGNGNASLGVAMHLAAHPAMSARTQGWNSEWSAGSHWPRDRVIRTPL